MVRKIILFVVITLVVIGGIFVGYNRYIETSTLDGKAWGVLQNYLEAAKNHDIERLKSLSYQVSESCQSAATSTDCNTKMDTVYFFGSGMQKRDFKNIWSDSKQIILSTDLKREENENMIGFSRAIVYFIIDDNGSIKLLKFSDSKGVSMNKEGRTIEEIDTYLQKRMHDEDMDGMEDEIEECLGQPVECVKTDPKNRDADEDGYWDGVQAQFYK